MNIKIKALGQTIEHNGKVVMVSKDLLVNCMVLFVGMDVWREIEEDVEYEVL